MRKYLIPVLFLALAACQANVNVQPKPSTSPSSAPSASPTASPTSMPSADPSIVINSQFNTALSGPAGEDHMSAMHYGASLTSDRFNRPNQALRLNGESSYYRINYNINPSKLPRATINIWARYENAEQIGQGFHTVISHDDSEYDRTISIDERAGSWGWSAFAGSKEVLGVAPVTPNAWVMLTAVYDQNAKTAALYVNGNLVKAETDATLGEGKSYLLLGMNPGYAAHFMGSVDDLSIYNRALTAAEVKALHTFQSVAR